MSDPDLFAGSQVTELTAEDFNIHGSSVQCLHPKCQHSDGWIMVYSPQCVHCHNKAPMWKKLASYTINDPQGLIGVVNGEKPENQLLIESLKVEGFPTFFYIHNDGLMFESQSELDELWSVL